MWKLRKLEGRERAACRRDGVRPYEHAEQTRRSRRTLPRVLGRCSDGRQWLQDLCCEHGSGEFSAAVVVVAACVVPSTLRPGRTARALVCCRGPLLIAPCCEQCCLSIAAAVLQAICLCIRWPCPWPCSCVGQGERFSTENVPPQRPVPLGSRKCCSCETTTSAQRKGQTAVTSAVRTLPHLHPLQTMFDRLPG